MHIHLKIFTDEFIVVKSPMPVLYVENDLQLQAICIITK